MPLTRTQVVNWQTLARSLFDSNNFDDLNALFARVQLQYDDGTLTEDLLQSAFNAFYSADPRLAPKYDAWVMHFPHSYVAHLARAIYYRHLSLKERADETNGTSVPERTRRIEADDLRALQDLNESLALESKPLLSYLNAIRISSDAGERRRLFNLAVEAMPDTFIIREAYMTVLQSRFGGSLNQMKAFLRECQQAHLSAIHMHEMQAFIREEEGRIDEYVTKNYAGAEAEFRKAAALDPCHCLHALNGELASALMKESKYRAAIVYLTRMVERNSDDAVALSNRGIAYSKTGQQARALDDWIAAAERGDSYSQAQAVALYRDGIPGVVAPNSHASIGFGHTDLPDGTRRYMHWLHNTEPLPNDPIAPPSTTKFSQEP